MKRIGMAVALLVAVAAGNAWAQAGGNTPGKPTPAAGGAISSTPGAQSTTARQKNGLRTGSGAKLSQSGMAPDNSQSNGAPSRKGGKGSTVNQQAAGVPTSGSANASRPNKPTRNQ